MTNSVSIGDLSRAALLRQANAQLKSRLLVLTQESASGVKSDMAQAVGGNFGHLAQVEARLTTLAAYRETAAAAQAELAGLQAALETIGKIGSEIGNGMSSGVSATDETSISIRSRQARDDLNAVVGLMNVEIGGRFLLSGSAVETRPMGDAAGILADARAQVAGLTDPAAIAAAISGWFGAAPGLGGFADTWFGGNTDTRMVASSSQAAVTQTLTGLDPSFRDILKGLVLGALADDPAVALAREDKAALVAQAGTTTLAGVRALTMRRAEVGMQEEAIARDAARNAAETTAMSIARTRIVEADPYETASALTQTETSLQNLYALTARLSRLSLTDYLR
ncbi:hypothetical protein [Paracoccus sp. SJTW-4]|uniref:hypothetical protein n=1 Tax=Paracoccus sp. SJTW-4 TaxID=3078428 RepID=UPI0039EB2509